MGGLLLELSQRLPAGVALRARSDADLPFLAQLYSTTREDEMRLVDWTPEQKTAFVLDQFSKQHSHYLAHYPAALWLVIEEAGEPVGRIYIEQTAREIRLMDIALLPASRGKGIGTVLTRALLAHADRARLPVSLHVEPANPAHRMYTRLGFREKETRGYYLFMERPVPN